MLYANKLGEYNHLFYIAIFWVFHFFRLHLQPSDSTVLVDARIRTQGCCNVCIGNQTLQALASRLDLIHSRLDVINVHLFLHKVKTQIPKMTEIFTTPPVVEARCCIQL